MNIYRLLLKTSIIGSSAIILLCFAWYSFLGEGKNGQGDYFTAYKLDRLCIESRDPRSWNCYRAEIHRENALALAEWGMRCGLIGTIATVGLAVSKKEDNQSPS